MNQLQKIFEQSQNASEYSLNYLKYLTEIVSKVNSAEIGTFIELLLEVRKNSGSIYFIGNGGSAATASHFANDIQIGTRSPQNPFRAVSLTDNVAILTAIGNDYGYESVFTKQLESLLKPQDAVVAISASGNSPNVVSAVQYSKQLGCKTMSLTGFDGGELKKITDYNIHIPTDKGEYGPVEDFHMIIDHIVGSYLMYYVKRNDQ